MSRESPAIRSELSNFLSMNRRAFIQTTLATGGAFTTYGLFNSACAGNVGDQRYKIAVCDWMILRRQKLGAFALTREIGADGLELDMGGLGDRTTFDNKLNDPAVRETFLSAARQHGLAAPSRCRASSQSRGVG